MKNIIIILIIAYSMYSCTDYGDNNLENEGVTTNVAYGSFNPCANLKEEPTQPSFLILNSYEEVQKLFLTCQSEAITLPDFSQKRIVGIFAGSKPGNFTIKIQSIVEDDFKVIVEYFENELKQEENSIITYPADYAVLPQSNKPILFKKVKKIVDYIIIGRYSFYCPSNCTSSYRIDDAKTIRFLTKNTTIAGSYESVVAKENFFDFVSKIPQEIIDLKGQTKEFKDDFIADGGGCYFEYHQGDVVTKIMFTNFNAQYNDQENLETFMNFIFSKVMLLDASK